MHTCTLACEQSAEVVAKPPTEMPSNDMHMYMHAHMHSCTLTCEQSAEVVAKPPTEMPSNAIAG